jgi:tetraacyldisaccharide 4'-kinase
MPIKTPHFWTELSWQSVILFPVSYIWRFGHYAQQKILNTKETEIPVICVGNLTVGGSGKTPVVITLCRFLSGIGKSTSILTRGFGGKEKGPIFVSTNLHQSLDVGDEPLMMANSLDVCVSRNRPLGANHILDKKKYDCIVMDDGLQNPTLKKDLNIAVFDGKFGIGNGFLLPAGPMRQKLEVGIQNIDLVIFNGKDETGLGQKIPPHIPIFTGELQPDEEIVEKMKNRRVYGFAGIGNPSRFFKTLNNIGADLVGEAHFADHHPYTDADLTQLYEEAMQSGAELVTTQKDWMRLPTDWRDRVLTVPVRIHFSADDTIKIVSFLETIFENVISS